MTGDVIMLQDAPDVYAVPPLPRKPDARRGLDFRAAECLVRHIEACLDGLLRRADRRLLIRDRLLPYVSPLDARQLERLTPVARALRERDA
jgi:hypothetical protein